MKRLFKLAFLMLCSFSIHAQQTDSLRTPAVRKEVKTLTPEQRAIRRYRLLKSDISIDNEQSEKVKKLFIDFENSRQDILAKYKAGSADAKKELKMLHQGMEKNMGEVIGQEKLDAWKKIRKDRAEQKRTSGKKPQKTPDTGEDFY